MAHIGVGLQVKDPVAAVKRIVEHGRIEHVALDEPDSRSFQYPGHELTSSDAEVIDDHDLDVCCAQTVSQVAADEPGATCDAGTPHGADPRGPRRRDQVPEEAVRIGYSVKPAATASPWNILTVSSEYCSRSLPRQSSFFSRSWVTVMM
jgi:hypothetical protein